jgi:hypothetical protein
MHDGNLDDAAFADKRLPDSGSVDPRSSSIIPSANLIC